MVVTYLPSITTQEDDWEPEMYIRTDETLTVKIETDRGLPIDYIVNWGSDDSSKEKICPTCKDVLSSSLKVCRSCGYELK